MRSCHYLRAQYGYEYHESQRVRSALSKGRVPIMPYQFKVLHGPLVRESVNNAIECARMRVLARVSVKDILSFARAE